MKNHTKIFWFMAFYIELSLMQNHCVIRFIRVYNGTRYLVLLSPEKYDAIYDRIRYLINQNSVVILGMSHNYARNKVDSYNSLPLEKNIDFT